MASEPSENDPVYNEWRAARRAVEPSPELTDRVMAAVTDRHARPERTAGITHQINNSRLARWTACSAAMLVGSLPFLLVAYVAELLVF